MKKMKASNSMLLFTSTKKALFATFFRTLQDALNFPRKCVRWLCQFFKTENSLTTTNIPQTILRCHLRSLIKCCSFPDQASYFWNWHKEHLSVFFPFMCQANFQRVPSFGLIFKISMDFQFQNASGSLLFSDPAPIGKYLLSTSSHLGGIKCPVF